MNQIDKFYGAKNLFQCPICGKKIRFHAGGLVCKREHRFDISSKGYVNFLQSAKQLKGYGGAFFESRRRFFAGGFYDDLAEAVVDTVCAHLADAVAGRETGAGAGSDRPLCVLDAGCGEGYYMQKLSRKLNCGGGKDEAQLLAFDIAAEAIKLAAKGETDIKWMVADITNIPVKDRVCDCLLDIFTPANYDEFTRILSPEGIVIKVVPAEGHLKELRAAAAPLLRSTSYSNAEVVEGFDKQFELIERRTVTKTRKITAQQVEDLAAMTPLLFDVDRSKLDLSQVTEITVEAEVLVGRRRENL